MLLKSAFLATIATTTATVLWDGRFNDLSYSTDLNKWSWANQVGPYQYYIHGSGAVTQYVNLASSYKNPADTGSAQGVKITLDSTAFWNGQTMRRTELIPQTTAAINAGKVWYHFSIKRSGTNVPNIKREHQIAFFESHFTELKYGGDSGVADPSLRWAVGGVAKWSTAWDADVWHNVAYEIDFSASTVAFWHSTGSNPLTLTVAAVSASTSSNGADWHLGVLELPVSGQPDTDEDIYFSGVYIESGSLTTNIAGPGAPAGTTKASTSTAVSTTKAATSSSSSTTLKTVTTTKAATSSTSTKASTTTTVRASTTTTVKTTATTTRSSSVPSSTAVSEKYGQCGGVSWPGPYACAAGSTCTFVNDFYSQCL